MISFVFLSQLSHFYALTLKHSTLIYSHSCYSHRSWLPVHTLFSITSLSFVSHFIVPLYVSEEKGRKLVYTFTEYWSLLCVFKLRVRGSFLYIIIIIIIIMIIIIIIIIIVIIIIIIIVCIYKILMHDKT